MTYDTERTPRIPTESPTTAEQSAVPAEQPPVTTEQPPAGAGRATEQSPRAAGQPPAASPTASPRASSSAGEPASAADRPLFREADQEKLALRLQQAVTEFVENPTRAVEEAEGAFDAAVDGLAHALKERRREMDVQQQGRESGTRTEELRIVLQQYRDLTERLLKV
ncbi:MULTISPECIES: hypothetical protein [unclassified Streptomyces]|uniref:hypothetical protein n=1 Tax=unclassified Streptomyces TaxID=2593676 RepID=UPI002E0D304F|nr:hypothetical protein OG384_00625 [Streptomyces sp. NBC_01324]